MIKPVSLLLLAAVLCGSCGSRTGRTAATSCDEPSARPSEYVSTLVGTHSDFTLSTGNTYPAVALPWGMNFWTPQTGEMGSGWAYTYGAHTIRGLKQTHQPSPWINDYGQFSIMPIRGRDKVDEESRQSWFSHQSEEARPYYYSVYLADHDIKAEIAPTERAAIMRFTFPESDESGVVIDAFDRGSYIRVMHDKRTVVGYTTRNSGGVPDNFKNWFIVRFDRKIRDFQIYDGTKPVEGEQLVGEHALVRVGFETRRGEQVTVRAASSFISQMQAVQNLEELGKDDFETVKAKAQAHWDEVLGRIEVEGGTTDQYRTFYSCLYRSTLFPRKFYEIDKNGNILHYSPYNGEVLPGYMYTDTGFWDTFRSLFPLLNLVYPSVNAEIQAGLANAYRESGFLPEWASPGHRGCMVGNNSASVVSDAILKGVTPEEDIATLYEAMLAGRRKVHPTVSSTGRWGYEYYNTLGYVPYDVNIPENAARTLEYAYDDWCIAQVAKKLGKNQSTVANKLRLLQFSEEVREAILEAGLTERHARALLNLNEQGDELLLEAIRTISAKEMNVSQTEKYIAQLQGKEEKPKEKRLFVVKDLRIFINTIDKALETMKLSGIQAQTQMQEEEDELVYTIRIPKESAYGKDKQ